MSKNFVLIPNVEVCTYTSVPLTPFHADASQQAANKIVDRLQGRSSYVDRMFSTTMFKKEAAAALSLPGDLGDKDLKILLKYLARDRRFLVCNESVGITESCWESQLTLAGRQNQWPRRHPHTYLE